MAQPDTWKKRLAPIFAITLALLYSCQADAPISPHGALVINEVMSDNDAAWIDEAGEVTDYIEIANRSPQPISLRGLALRGDAGRPFEFPERTLEPGELAIVYADDDAQQGPMHASWKISADGETLELFELTTGNPIDHVSVPALGLNETYSRFPSGRGAFGPCRYASPLRDNGESCLPPAPAELPEDSLWQHYAWPENWGKPKGPLVLNELALRPARFIEVTNIGKAEVSLAEHALRLAPARPGVPWPARDEGVAIAWPKESIAPGEHLTVAVPAEVTAPIEADPAFEGVATLFAADGGVVDRVDFMRWPERATLARTPEGRGLRFCARDSRGAPNAEACDPLVRREVGDRLRHLYTPGDYAALAEGETNLSLQGVKFVIDLAAGEAVHLLSTRAWALHYTFVREQIDLEPRLDRCDPLQAEQFYAGWVAFSDREYFQVETRRYLLGTLVRYAGSDLRTLDFAVGDQIVAPQMQRAFFTAMRHADAESPSAWSLHPTEPRQVPELRKLEGQAPVVGANAPFRNLRYQPLTEGVAFGTLTYVDAAELEGAALGQDVIVVTDAVPNDLPFVSGLITEAFQTPLAHVNVLSQNRGTPNMALRDARRDPRIREHLSRLVRLEVSGAGFELRSASAEEVAEFLRSREPSGPRIAPRLDRNLRGVVDLATRSLLDLPAIGAKAAQLAELGRIGPIQCVDPLALPEQSFAVPLVHYLEHFERSGARELLAEVERDPMFRADLQTRDALLGRVRARIEETPVDPGLRMDVETAIATRWGERRVRFRSSSNTEDLPGFNGAGLYLSLPAELGDPERTVDRALRAVWASLWNTRAYDEREFGHIDQSQVAMGVLVHPSFVSERANVIAISRDVLDPTRADIHYLNAQEGEASVANPAPGVTTEQLVHHWRLVPGTPAIEYQAKSSLTGGRDVLSMYDVSRISCQLAAVHDHFRRVLDPAGQNRWFAMDVELKLVGEDRRVVFKQARPYTFGRTERPTDCREF